MAFDFGSFVNAGQFSDPANYSGLGGQMPSVKEVAEKAALASIMGGKMPDAAPSADVGVAPPAESPSISDAFSNYSKQAIAPLQQKFDNMMQLGSNVSQGNFGAAANQLLGNQPQKFQNAYSGFQNAIDKHFTGGQ